MLLVYVTCKDETESEKISKILLEKKLCACTNIIKEMKSFYFWPPKSHKVESANEVILIVKIIDAEFEKIKNVVKEMHSYEFPSIFGIKMDYIDEDFKNYLTTEII